MRILPYWSDRCCRKETLALWLGPARNRYADHIHTGHNADDIFETDLMSILGGDIARLGRGTAIIVTPESSLTTVPQFKPVKEEKNQNCSLVHGGQRKTTYTEDL